MTDEETPVTGGDENRAAMTQDLETIQSRLNHVADRQLPLVVATLRRIFGTELDDLAELPALADDFQDRLAALDARLERVEARLETFDGIDAEPTSKADKIARVLAYASNKGDAGQSTVAVSAAEIKGCVGVSRRYAYDLVEAIAGEVGGCRLREAKTVQTSTGTKHKPKAVLVDCEGVHGPDGAVNSFTTENGAATAGQSVQTNGEVEK